MPAERLAELERQIAAINAALVSGNPGQCSDMGYNTALSQMTDAIKGLTTEISRSRFAQLEKEARVSE